MLPLLQSVQRWIGYLSLKYKLFILLVAISIFPISLVSYSSQHFMFRSSTEHSASISSQYVQFVSHDITSYLQDLSQSFDSLLTNPDFQKFLETPDDDLVQQANYIINFRPVLKKIPFNSGTRCSVFFILTKWENRILNRIRSALTMNTLFKRIIYTGRFIK